MPMIVVSGPEKAGKTTFCNLLEQEWRTNFGEVTRRSWHHRDRNPEDLRDTRNLAALVEDLQPAKTTNHLVIWDRSYVCEAVYGLLLGRKSDLADNLLLGEWLYGRAVRSLGRSIVLLPSSVSELRRRRTEDDHQIDPSLEVHAYRNYARQNALDTLANDYTEDCLLELANEWVQELAQEHLQHRGWPPGYCGPRDAGVVVVSDSFEANAWNGEWLPLSHKDGFRLANDLLNGDPDYPHPLTLGWCTARQCPPNLLRKARTLIALSDDARLWCQHYTGCPDVRVITSGLHTGPSRTKIAHLIQTVVADAERVQLQRIHSGEVAK